MVDTSHTAAALIQLKLHGSQSAISKKETTGKSGGQKTNKSLARRKRLDFLLNPLCPPQYPAVGALLAGQYGNDDDVYNKVCSGWVLRSRLVLVTGEDEVKWSSFH